MPSGLRVCLCIAVGPPGAKVSGLASLIRPVRTEAPTGRISHRILDTATSNHTGLRDFLKLYLLASYFLSWNPQAHLQGHPSGVIKSNVLFNILLQFLKTLIGLEAVHLLFDDSPEVLHRPVIDAFTHSGHALDEAVFCHEFFEAMRCILEPAVTVQQRFAWDKLVLDLADGISDQGVVVGLRQLIGHNFIFPIIQNRAEISFGLLPVLEFRDIGQQHCHRLVGLSEFPVQDVLCHMCWLVRFIGIAFPADNGLQARQFHQAVHKLMVHFRAQEMVEIDGDAAVAVNPPVLFIDLKNQSHQLTQTFFRRGGFPVQPLVVAGAAHF